MSGTSGNKDGDAGTFFPPACPGYRHHSVGGKPPPPTVPPIQHAGAIVCTEQDSPCHIPVRQWGGKEEQTAGGRGAAGDFIEGLLGLRGTVGYYDIVQIYMKVSDDSGRRLSGSGKQPEEG